MRRIMRIALPPRDLVVTFVVAVLLQQAPAIYGQSSEAIADAKFDVKVAKPAYVDKHPNVLFDEGHFNYHTSGGRYKPFVDLIKNDGYRVTANHEKFTKKTLEGFDILVISNAASAKGFESPDPAFTKGECDAVHDWVRAGGNLLLIADHWPHGAAAEMMTSRFGVDASKGATRDAANYDKVGNVGWLVFTRENGLLADHAITNGRFDAEKVKRIVSFTGQSLKGPEGSVAFLKLADTAQDRVYPDRNLVSAKGRAQGVALRLDKGRVVVLGEAAMLSAQRVIEEGKPDIPFGMNVPGTDDRQLALNVMHWLSDLTN